MTSYELVGPEKVYRVEVSRAGDEFTITSGSQTFPLQLRRTDEDGIVVARFADKPVTVVVMEASSQRVVLSMAGEQLTFVRPMAALAATQVRVPQRVVSQDTLASPIPGRVVSISVTAGDAVAEGESIATIESMKMESVIRSDRNALVEKVLVTEGSTVRRGQDLVKFVST